MAICWERAFPLAFHLCCFYFSAVLIVGVPFRLMFRAGYGIRLYRFLIIAFLFALYTVFQFVTSCQNNVHQNRIENCILDTFSKKFVILASFDKNQHTFSTN